MFNRGVRRALEARDFIISTWSSLCVEKAYLVISLPAGKLTV